MAGFILVCFGVPALLATLTQAATNPAEDAAREKMLRQRGGLDSQMLAKVRLAGLGAAAADKRPQRQPHSWSSFADAAHRPTEKGWRCCCPRWRESKTEMRVGERLWTVGRSAPAPGARGVDTAG
jgi:hypothetical protein